MCTCMTYTNGDFYFGRNLDLEYSFGEQVTVTASDEDPTVCLVEFTFAVAHGLNQIYLTVHITI